MRGGAITALLLEAVLLPFLAVPTERLAVPRMGALFGARFWASRLFACQATPVLGTKTGARFGYQKRYSFWVPKRRPKRGPRRASVLCTRPGAYF